MSDISAYDRLVEKRLERAARFCGITASSWAAYAAYHCLTQGWNTAAISGTMAALIALLIPLCHRFPQSRWWIATCNLGLCALGLFLESLFSGCGNSDTPFCFAVLGLLAAHQTGGRSTAFWTLIGISMIAVLNGNLTPDTLPVYRDSTITDRMMVQSGVAIVIFFMSMHAEWSFDRYAVQLGLVTDELKEQAQTLLLAEEVANVGHWRWNVQSGEVTVSSQAARILGLPADTEIATFPQQAFLDSFEQESAHEMQTALMLTVQSEFHFDLDLERHLASGTQFIKCIGSSEYLSTGEMTGAFGVVKDETEFRVAQDQLSRKAEELHELAEFDQLSGLPNRRQFKNRLDESVARCDKEGSQMALLLIDLDGFKEINDTMGHACGDDVLKIVAHRMKGITRQGDLVARLGGDEFTVILESMRTVEDVSRTTTAINRALREPMWINGKKLRVGASIGSAIYPLHTRDTLELLAFADTAMYEAKAQDMGSIVYKPSMTEAIVQRRNKEAELQIAIANNEFFLEYQPLVGSDGLILGAEALLRWNRGDQVIRPSQFIPQLEASGLIATAGNWVMRTACAQGKQWQREGNEISVSVNVSSVQFRDPRFVDNVIEALESSQLSPRLLDLEITESVLIDEIDETMSKVAFLKEIGVNISIDDFGTGYSSLSYLKHLPFDRIKIDRDFVRDIPNEYDSAIAKTVILLGHSLGMSVLAEGVETQEQFEFLSQHGCNEFQGFLFSKPIAPQAVSRLVQSRRRWTPAISSDLITQGESMLIPASAEQDA